MDVSQTMQCVSSFRNHLSSGFCLVIRTHSVGFCKAAVHEDMMAMPCEEDGKVALWDLRTGNAIASVLETGEEKTGMINIFYFILFYFSFIHIINRTLYGNSPLSTERRCIL